MTLENYGGLSPVYFTMQAAASIAVAHPDPEDRRAAFGLMRAVIADGLPPRQPAGAALTSLFAAYREYLKEVHDGKR